SKEARTLTVPCAGYVLHPVQAASVDPVVQGSAYDAGTCTVSVPGRTAAVFWERRPVSEQLTLLIGEIDELVASGVLNHGQGNALRVKLENARSKLLSDKAASQIQAFINQVQDLAADGILTAEQAAALIRDAEEALADLG
ncbi:MAG: alpha-1,6-glucosidase domain-containing protein, partial [Thermoanaerobaculia bacterium]